MWLKNCLKCNQLEEVYSQEHNTAINSGSFLCYLTPVSLVNEHHRVVGKTHWIQTIRTSILQMLCNDFSMLTSSCFVCFHFQTLFHVTPGLPSPHVTSTILTSLPLCSECALSRVQLTSSGAFTENVLTVGPCSGTKNSQGRSITGTRTPERQMMMFTSLLWRSRMRLGREMEKEDVRFDYEGESKSNKICGTPAWCYLKILACFFKPWSHCHWDFIFLSHWRAFKPQWRLWERHASFSIYFICRMNILHEQRETTMNSSTDILWCGLRQTEVWQFFSVGKNFSFHSVIKQTEENI